MAEVVRLLHPVELVGSTHAQRVKALSEAFRRVDPQTDRVTWDALWDAYLICMAHNEGHGG